MNANNLLNFKKNIFSQNGEDGIIEKIFFEIGTKFKSCCEFGAWDGVHLSNCRNLILNGWSCVFIETDQTKYGDLVKNYQGFTNVHCINKLVDDKNNRISTILNELNIAGLDFLSIDIDGLDYDIFQSLDIYPRVICIEVQGGHSPESTTKLPGDIARKNIGQPLPLFVQIAKEKGYRLVCYTGNAFFIKNTEIENSSLHELTAVEAYTECLKHLDEKLREWLYFANKGLVEPYFVFNNPYLNFDINTDSLEVKRLINEALQLAVINHDAGNLRQEEYICTKILEIQPNNSNALHCLNDIHKDRKQFDGDTSRFQEARNLQKKSEANLQQDHNSSLDGNGERVDIKYGESINFDELDMYQKSHYRRYEFAQDLVRVGSTCGDFACGTGYGSVMIAENADRVIGADINSTVINAIKIRYHKISNVKFICSNLLSLNYDSFFDTIISFETVEHFAEDDIPRLFSIYHKALKPGGRIIFSVPYMQEHSEAAIKLGFHLTFDIDELKIEKWLKDANFKVDFYKYQNYETHTIQDNLDRKDFIICVAQKKMTMKEEPEHNMNDLADDEINRIEQFLASGNFEKAKETIFDTIKQNPNSTDLLNRVAHINFQMGDIKGAKEVLSDILRRDPDHVETLHDLALIEMLENDYEKAKNTLKKILQIDPENDAAVEKLQFMESATVDVKLFADRQSVDSIYGIIDTDVCENTKELKFTPEESVEFPKSKEMGNDDEKDKTTTEGYIFELEREREAHIQEITNLRRQIDSMNATFEKNILLPKAGLTYAQDLLYTYHNADFMKDALFSQTYALVKKIDDGHLLNNYDIQWRIHVLCWAAFHAKNLEGDFVDCGVSTGLFARGVINYVNFQNLNKKYYLLDTFSGMDPRYSSSYEMQRNETLGYSKKIGVFERVKETFSGFNVEIIKGAIPDTLSQVRTQKVCYLSIDMNCVGPEIAALEFFWDKMVSGGIIILDDYGYPGCIEQKNAHDAFAKSKDVQVLSLPTCQGMIIKPYAQKPDVGMRIASYETNEEKPVLVSIAIPSYEMHGRGVEFIDFSLTKISQQTYKNIEVVISDHSRDNGIKNVCNKWNSLLNIKYSRNENKRGNSSANLNNAIINCTGDLIKILFQDDFLFSEKSIEVIVDMFSKNPATYWLITACEHSHDGASFYRPFYPQYNDKIYLGPNTISSPSVLTIRNKDVLPFDERLIWLMDCDYYKRLYTKFGPPLILNDVNVVNRTWNNQISNLVSEGTKKRELNYIKNKYEKIYLSENSKIYIAVPYRYETGGVEALHQLSHKLTQLGYACYVAYKTGVFSDILLNGKPPSGIYDNYIVKEADHIEDNEENLLIVPEVWTQLLDHFRNIRKCIWWLSVDNNLRSGEGQFKNWNDRHVVHLFQSSYVKKYVNGNGATGYYLGEYINSLFLQKSCQITNRKNYVLFNPSQGYEITKEIIENIKDNAISFIPLKGYEMSQLIDLYNESKIYIDFGNHPGMDRIPRETAINGCCIIVGKIGAARLQRDIPIPPEYKFRAHDIKGICSKIKDCIYNYNLRINDFEIYRNFIRFQENKMEKNIRQIFKRNMKS